MTCLLRPGEIGDEGFSWQTGSTLSAFPYAIMAQQQNDIIKGHCTQDEPRLSDALSTPGHFLVGQQADMSALTVAKHNPKPRPEPLWICNQWSYDDKVTMFPNVPRLLCSLPYSSRYSLML